MWLLLLSDAPPTGGMQAKTLTGGLGFVGLPTQRTIAKRTGAIASAGSMRRATARRAGGAIAPSGTTQQRQRAVRAGALTSTGTVTKRDRKPVAGVVTSSGTATRRMTANRTGALTTSGTIARRTRRALMAVLLTAGLLVRRFRGTRVGSWTSTGTTRRVPRGHLSGSLGPSGSLRRTTRKPVLAVLTSVGTLAFGTARTLLLAGTLALAGGLRRATASRWTGGLSWQGIARQRQAARRIGALSSRGTMARRTSKPTGGTFAPSGGTSRRFAAVRVGVVGTVGAVRRVTRLVKRGALTTVGVLTLPGKLALALFGAVGFSGTTVSRGRISPRGMLGTGGTVHRTTAGRRAGILSASGSRRGQATRTRTGSVGFGGVAQRLVRLPRAGALAFSGLLSLPGRALLALGGVLECTGLVSSRTRTTTRGTFHLTQPEFFSGEFDPGEFWSGPLRRITHTVVQGRWSPTGWLGTWRGRGLTLLGTLGFTGHATARARVGLRGAFGSDGSVRRIVARSASGAVVLAGALTRRALLHRVGALLTDGLLTSSRQLTLLLVGTLQWGGTLQRRTRARLAGTWRATGLVVGQGIQLTLDYAGRRLRVLSGTTRARLAQSEFSGGFFPGEFWAGARRRVRALLRTGRTRVRRKG